MKKNWWFAIPLLAALAAGSWLAHTRYAATTPEAPAVSALWALSFPDTTGHPQSLAQWRGQIVVLNFWASWCAPCREEMPDFVKLRAQHHVKGVEFVGIAIDNTDNVAKFLRKQPVNYPILIGEGAAHSLARQLGNPSGALPYTIVLDRNGDVAMTHLGRLPADTLRAALSKLGA
ncbi:MAG: TlpA family protein disulfide reductase [Thiobacillus sp.]|nr:TlpA family protein disulfide reductase [Thiobacillus sp.]